jgi:ABC transporter DrrB family efflux protein
MSTVTAPTRRMATPRRQTSSGRVVADGLAVTGRNLLHWTRQPQLVVFSTIQPVMFVLLFRYVFGGAIAGLPPGVEYATYLMPGILVQSVAFGSTQAAVGMATDLAGGIIDRFRSLPMARSAVLVGRTVSDLVRNLFVVLLMIGVGYLVGFRFTGGILYALGAIAIVVLFGFALTWMMAFVGLAVRGVEAAQAATFVAIFPLIFASSAFVPLQTMPTWLQAFARNTPVTKVIDAARSLVIGGDVGQVVAGGSIGETYLVALAWIAGLLAAFVPLAVARYRRT